MDSGFQFVLARLPQCFRTVCLDHSHSFPEVYGSALRTLAFLKILLATTTLTRLLSALSRSHMGPGARWGSISILAPSQPRRGQAGWVLPSDWRSPRIWPFPAVTRTRRVDVVAANLSDNESASASSKDLLFTGFRLFAIASVNFYGSWLDLVYAAVACAVLVSAPV
jgi:hypothetical protein